MTTSKFRSSATILPKPHLFKVTYSGLYGNSASYWVCMGRRVCRADVNRLIAYKKWRAEIEVIENPDEHVHQYNHLGMCNSCRSWKVGYRPEINH